MARALPGRPDDRTNPEFDLIRSEVGYWRRYERMLEASDRHGVQVSVCFFIGGQQLPVPFAMWSEDEMRYYRYAIGIECARRYPYAHLRGIHNKPYYAAWRTWLTIQLRQTWDAGLADELAERRTGRVDLTVERLAG